MLLDLNVGFVSGDSVFHVITALELEKKFSEKDSATSSSSVLSTEDVRQNDAEKISSAFNSSPLIFDILKVETPVPEFVTRELFPATVSSTSAKAQWLNNMSFVGKNGLAELSIVHPKQLPLRKSRRGPRSRSSQYRGVTFYRRTGRWESHIWDSGKQVYLGGFDSAYAAARAYDQAAIKFRGVDADINFSVEDYKEAMKQTQNLNKEEFVLRLRGRRTIFPGRSSKYRGVTPQKCGPWEAHTGQFLENKEYDKATLHGNIREAATNLGPSTCEANVVIHANSGGNFYNLDLSLGIGMSSPSNAQKGNVNANDFRFQYGEMPARMEKMTENPALLAPLARDSLGGLPVTSQHSWSGIYPSYSQTLEARTWHGK